MKYKACTKCGEVKSLDEFRRDSSKKDGRECRCKACKDSYRQTPRGLQVNAESARRYRQTDKGGVAKSRANKIARSRYPERMRARQAVNGAIRYGKLTRQPCVICGSPKSEAHHDSYEQHRWLDVVWLCQEHHRERHKGLAA